MRLHGYDRAPGPRQAAASGQVGDEALTRLTLAPGQREQCSLQVDAVAVGLGGRETRRGGVPHVPGHGAASPQQVEREIAGHV